MVLAATIAVAGAAATSSSFAEPSAREAHAVGDHGHSPFGASTIGRGIAGQHDHFRGGASASRHHFDHSPYGASTMGRGIAGFHSRL